MNESSAHGPPAAPDVTDSHWESLHKQDAVEYDPDSEIYRTSFDSASQSVGEAITSTVAVVSETPPLELPPLYSVIDPEAVERLVGRPESESSSSDTHVSFAFNGYDVTVHSYGIITLQQPGH